MTEKPKPRNWHKLGPLQLGLLILNENVSDVIRRPCICGDGVWWRSKLDHPWKCRTCEPTNANAQVYWIRRKKVVDPTDLEVAAIQAASEPAGEYLDSLGETDLAKLSEENWLTLIEIIVTSYQDKLRELGGTDS